jgi:hypothetical protein
VPCGTADIFAERLIHDKDAARPRELSKTWDAKYSGANMTNETMKALLMILIIGGLQAAIHIPKIWASQQWAFLSARWPTSGRRLS